MASACGLRAGVQRRRSGACSEARRARVLRRKASVVEEGHGAATESAWSAAKFPLVTAQFLFLAATPLDNWLSLLGLGRFDKLPKPSEGLMQRFRQRSAADAMRVALRKHLLSVVHLGSGTGRP